MEDVVPADSQDGSDAMSPDDAAPAMPVIGPDEHCMTPVVDGSYMIGWDWRSAAKGGPCFITFRRSGLGGWKVLERFPLTPQGWARAWEALAVLDPSAAERTRAGLENRKLREAEHARPPDLGELDGRTLVRMPGVALLGGYAPRAHIAVGEKYDARFLEDRLVICAPRDWGILAEVPYLEVEDVEIGGPGLVKTGGGFAGGGFGAAGALEGMAVAAVLNALATRTTITTVVRVQAVKCELFLLWTKTTPGQLRIALSRPLGEIRLARAAANQPPSQASPVSELSKLADMLQAGLLTREEFDQLKAKLLQA